jgi:hypothetical protein
VAGEKTFRKAFALLDSSIEGERQAALHQVRGLLAKQQPPRLFRDLLDALDNAAPLEKYRALEAELQKFIAANQGLEQQNAALAKAAAPPRRSSWWVIWAARVEGAAIAATVAAVIAAGAHHQAMTAKAAQFGARLHLVGEMIANAEMAEKLKWKIAGSYRTALKAQTQHSCHQMQSSGHAIRAVMAR